MQQQPLASGMTVVGIGCHIKVSPFRCCLSSVAKAGCVAPCHLVLQQQVCVLTLAVA